MKRCGVFVFYNEYGVIESYVEYLLKSLETVLDKLVIVVNGKINPEEKRKLEQYSNEIFQRRNAGFDGGAYKDVFVDFLKGWDWGEWDEILLVNNTFYGPFISWDEVFEVMEGGGFDFWGLSCHPGGREDFFKGEIISSHVQSYFIMIKKQMFCDPSFLEFWREMPYPKSFKDAVKDFEIHFSEYFVGKGFSFASWIDRRAKQLGKNRCFDVNDIETVITELGFPVFKRKAYMLQNYIHLKTLFQYLSANNNYLFKMIETDLFQRCIDGKLKPYNPIQILKFCNQYENIYLFGNGNYAKNIESFLKDYGKQVEGYIISKKTKMQHNVYELEVFEMREDVGIIVAVNYRNFCEVSEKLHRKISLKQLFIPFYDY